MTILVLSDSHGGKSFMRECIRMLQPHAVIHLGDYYSDAEDMEETAVLNDEVVDETPADEE